MRLAISILLAMAALAAARMPLIRAGENPRSSAVHIERGLTAESAHDFATAERELLTAVALDRQYLPAWTLANYYFRRADRENFWPWAKRAADLSFDDAAPLLALADMFDPGHALDRLGRSSKLQRAYLDLLIRDDRWPDAMAVARLMASDAGNFPRLRAFTTHLIAAKRGDQAFEIWNRVADRNPHPPTGEGFDWKLESNPHMTAGWRDGEFEFWLDGHEDDVVALVERTILIDRSEVTVRSQTRTTLTGLHWSLDSRVAGPLESSPEWREASETFTSRHPGLARLVLLYRRDPGALPAEGQIQVKLYE